MPRGLGGWMSMNECGLSCLLEFEVILDSLWCIIPYLSLDDFSAFSRGSL